MKIELLNDMYLEPQKSGGYSLYKRYTSKSGEPRRKRIAYAERVMTSNYAAASMICGKIESMMSYQKGES